ncbi:hypothetical protein [Nocardia sp. CA-120079]|uniref:hypothetical protein n=1 Tax=Nocardia sp. CA-120079 TaxID=3239974 RepID=UPI003D9A0789
MSRLAAMASRVTALPIFPPPMIPRVFVMRALSRVSTAQPTRRPDRLRYGTSGAITGAQPVIAPPGQLREG